MKKRQQRASPPDVGGPKRALPPTEVTKELKSAPEEAPEEEALREEPKPQPRVRELAEPEPEKPVTPRVLIYEITLVEGATYGARKGRTFVAGQPVVTSDPELVTFARGSSRFQVKLIGGAA